MAAIESIPRLPRVRACEKFEGHGKFCKACFWRRRWHKPKRTEDIVTSTPAASILARVYGPPRFVSVSCSQCGGSFGPGDSGYSHCEDHS